MVYATVQTAEVSSWKAALATETSLNLVSNYGRFSVGIFLASWNATLPIREAIRMYNRKWHCVSPFVPALSQVQWSWHRDQLPQKQRQHQSSWPPVSPDSRWCLSMENTVHLSACQTQTSSQDTGPMKTDVRIWCPKHVYIRWTASVNQNKKQQWFLTVTAQSFPLYYIIFTTEKLYSKYSKLKVTKPKQRMW